jgi:hypothetical protein
MVGGLRELHNEELRDLYSSSSIIRMIKWRRMRWAGHVARIGRRGICIDYWWRPLGGPICIWVDNIKIDGMGWCGLDWCGSG